MEALRSASKFKVGDVDVAENLAYLQPDFNGDFPRGLRGKLHRCAS